ncbi:hypothetical protein MPH_09335 [Macrophomina phaseolina MS6]|uniref:Uncharacterized protein n=1 Tax=Macrophomina phaseolina (strain MS6) TaxID=1126212 RepID=K2RG19_MACPH|nr:hypothetical protein MPH_09335 [Macrophomina phaseolina MS6]
MLSDTEAYRFRLDELLPVLLSDKSQFKARLISLSDDKYRELRPPEEFEDEQKYLDAIENAKNKSMQIMYVPVMSSAEAACSCRQILFFFFQTFSLTPLQCNRASHHCLHPYISSSVFHRRQYCLSLHEVAH